MRVGAYELGRQLGRGGMGTVYLALGPQGERVAVKVLRATRGQALARFDRERRLQGALGTEAGFVPILASGETATSPYIVMPVLEGGSLRERLISGPFAVEAGLALGRTLATILGRAHARGIVHRDLKPENILFDREGRPFIADLGLAKHFRSDVPGASRSAALSRPGEFRGTPGYVAPEQVIDAQSVGPPADVFSLAAILHEVLTGEPLFRGDGPHALVAQVFAAPPERLRQRLPDAPLWLDDVLATALDREPENRHRDGAAFAHALAEGAAPGPRLVTADVGATRPADSGASSSPPGLPRARAALGGVAALALVCGGATLVSHPASPAPPSPAGGRATPTPDGASRIGPTTSGSAARSERGVALDRALAAILGPLQSVVADASDDEAIHALRRSADHARALLRRLQETDPAVTAGPDALRTLGAPLVDVFPKLGTDLAVLRLGDGSRRFAGRAHVGQSLITLFLALGYDLEVIDFSVGIHEMGESKARPLDDPEALFLAPALVRDAALNLDAADATARIREAQGRLWLVRERARSREDRDPRARLFHGIASRLLLRLAESDVSPREPRRLLPADLPECERLVVEAVDRLGARWDVEISRGAIAAREPRTHESVQRATGHYLEAERLILETLAAEARDPSLVPGNLLRRARPFVPADSLARNRARCAWLAFESGDPEGALRHGAAARRFGSPATLGLVEARAHIALGQLTEARHAIARARSGPGPDATADAVEVELAAAEAKARAR